MTVQQLHYVITISETGSLNKASEILYVAQPSLTSSIKELEKELGISIFHRSCMCVILTNDGAEFLLYSRQLYQQYESLMQKYGKMGTLKKKFGISTQHYSFAVKSFVEMVKKFNTAEYEFAIRETKTKEVIEDVSTGNSEIGIIYLSNFNRMAMTKLFHTKDLEFHELTACEAYVYLGRGHPLAGCRSIRFEQLNEYLCLSFEQGDNSSFYFAEEILSTNEYARTIKANDRATMLNLMIDLDGYTLCSGIICEELNGSDYIAVPFEHENLETADRMVIGFITRKNMPLSRMGELYIEEIRQYLNQYDQSDKQKPIPYIYS
ncbi:MAG: LysR family transcriptional regulator [Clostridia bacterium]|nr:LysR family transcriptional regulator [Clostridia bacterium]